MKETKTEPKNKFNVRAIKTLKFYLYCSTNHNNIWFANDYDYENNELLVKQLKLHITNYWPDECFDYYFDENSFVVEFLEHVSLKKIQQFEKEITDILKAWGIKKNETK